MQGGESKLCNLCMNFVCTCCNLSSTKETASVLLNIVEKDFKECFLYAAHTVPLVFFSSFTLIKSMHKYSNKVCSLSSWTKHKLKALENMLQHETVQRSFYSMI